MKIEIWRKNGHVPFLKERQNKNSLCTHSQASQTDNSNVCTLLSTKRETKVVEKQTKIILKNNQKYFLFLCKPCTVRCKEKCTQQEQTKSEWNLEQNRCILENQKEWREKEKKNGFFNYSASKHSSFH